MEQKIKEIIQRNKAQQLANCFLPKNESEKEIVSIFNETLKCINNSLKEVLKSIEKEGEYEK